MLGSAFRAAIAVLVILVLTTGQCVLATRSRPRPIQLQAADLSEQNQINVDRTRLAARSLQEGPAEAGSEATLPTLSSDIPITSVILDPTEIGSHNAAESTVGAEPRKAIHRTYPGTNDDGDSDNDDASSSSRRSLIPTFKGPIRYHGGQLMTGQVNVYLLYVNYDRNSTAPTFINYMVSNLQGSPWWGIVTKYYSTVGGKTTYASGNIKLAGISYMTVPSSQSLDLTDIAPVGNFAAYAISKKWVPDDKTNGIYVVIPAKSRNIVLQGGRSGFCGSRGYCGWHSIHAGIKIALIPQADCAGCESPQQSDTRNGKYSPSGDPAVDAMCSTVAHELAETVTDPDTVKGWMDNSGNENADMCAYSYGTYSNRMFALSGQQPHKVYYNTLLGPQNFPYILQENWDPTLRPNSNKQVGCSSGVQ